MESLQSGEIFAGCRILHLCGRGGYGVVYLAENALGKRVAVKITEKVDDTHYKAKATLDNGNDIKIMIEDRGEEIYVTIPFDQD